MIEFTDRNIKDLKDFFDACNQLIAGKFILSDLEVASVIKSIHNSFILKEYISRCLAGYNFDRELTMAKPSNPGNNGYFKMPPDNASIVAMVYSLLLGVSEKRINLQTFIFQNFHSTKGYDATFNNFVIVMLEPLKNAIKETFGCDENGKPITKQPQTKKVQQISVEQIIYQKERREIKMSFNELQVSLSNLVMAVRNNSKLKIEHKENFIIVANAIMQCIKQEDLKMINALVVSFEYILGKNKQIRPYYYKFLESIANMV